MTRLTSISLQDSGRYYSTKPIVITTINNAITYFGAFEVIKKILFGSKNFNINYLK